MLAMQADRGELAGIREEYAIPRPAPSAPRSDASLSATAAFALLAPAGRANEHRDDVTPFVCQEEEEEEADQQFGREIASVFASRSIILHSSEWAACDVSGSAQEGKTSVEEQEGIQACCGERCSLSGRSGP